MPRRFDRSAPRFEKPEHLRTYLRDLEACLEEAEITQPEKKIKYALRYIDEDTLDLWEPISETVQADQNATEPDMWKRFKANLTTLYPASDPERRYALRDVEDLVRRTSSVPMTDRHELSAYYREFVKFTTYLIEKKRYSDSEQKRTFMLGFPKAFRERLDHRLSITCADTLPEDGYPIDEVLTQATRMLGGGSGPRSDSSSPKSTDPTVKLEQTLTSFFNRLESTIGATQGRNNNSGSSSSNTNSSTNNNAAPPRTAPPRNNNCMFCGETTHFIGRCPDASGYETAKKICRVNGKIATPDNQIVNPPFGSTIKSAVDNWHKTHSAPAASINLLEIALESLSAARIEEVPDEDDSEITSLEKELRLSHSKEEIIRLCTALSAAKDKKNRQVFDGVEITSRGPPRNRGPPKSTPTAPVVTQPNLTPAAAPTPASAPPVPPAAEPTAPKAKADERQYKFVSPGDDPTVIKTILDKSMEQSIQITQRQLFALSPEARKQMHNYTGNKKVAVQGPHMLLTDSADEHALEQFHVDYVPDPFSQSKDSPTLDFLTLRVINGLFDNKVQAECILDSGSQFIAMRRDVWERTDLFLIEDQGIILETANNGRSRTLGQVRRAELNLGGIKIFLQLQVVENAPFEVLLGRPFFAHTSCVTTDYPNGNQRITITDPLSGDRVTLPTHERIRQAPQCGPAHHEQHNQGF